MLFSRNAEENMRATSDRARLEAAINAAKVGSDSTRFGPALKLADSILSRSSLKRREAVLISDFQKSGWSGSEDVHFPEGMTVTPVSVASPDTSNLAVPSVTFARASFSGQERITVTAGLSNKGDAPLKDVPVTLTIDGHEIQTEHATIGAHASGSVTFTQFTLVGANVRGSVHAGSGSAAGRQHVLLRRSRRARRSRCLIVDSGDRGDASLFLSKALSIGTTPTFQVESVPAMRVTPPSLDKRAVVILNDTTVSIRGRRRRAEALRRARRRTARGRWAITRRGRRAKPTCCPAAWARTVDRMSGRSGSLGYLDYSHPVFEVFKAPRSGDFSAGHVFRYRTLHAGSGRPRARALRRWRRGGSGTARSARAASSPGRRRSTTRGPISR